MKILGIVAALFASVASAQTYDFSGVVTSYNQYLPGLVSVGTAVTGSFSIDYANAQSFTAPPGSPSFMAYEHGGNEVLPQGNAPPTIFSMTIQAGQVSYSTSTAENASESYSSVDGSNGVFSANELTYPVLPSFGENHYQNSSSIVLAGFTGAGLPVEGASGTGHVENFLMGSYDNRVDFTITRATQVQAPELDPSNGFAAITLLAGCMLILRSRHSKVSK